MMRRPEKLLAEHRQKKKRVISPLSQLKEEVEVKDPEWLERMLPELVWIGVAIQLEKGKGTNVFKELECLYKAVKRVGKDPETTNWAMATCWGELTTSEAQQAKDACKRIRWIPSAAEVICRRYKKCPLEILRNGRGKYEEQEKQRERDWAVIGEATLEGMGNQSRMGLILRGALLHYRLVTETIGLPHEGFNHEEIEEAMTDPESEMGRRGGSVLRAFSATECGLYKPKSQEWARVFWETNRRETRCWT